MERREKIEEASDSCDKKMFKMCSDRSKNNRNCVMPRCCGICNKILECEGYCRYIKNLNFI